LSVGSRVPGFGFLGPGFGFRVSGFGFRVCNVVLVAIGVPGFACRDFIRMSVFEKYDFSTKITAHVQLPVTPQSKFVAIFDANRIRDPRNRMSEMRLLGISCSFLAALAYALRAIRREREKEREREKASKRAREQASKREKSHPNPKVCTASQL